MAVRIESQAEPLPGYRLIERLGGGGFGEVWKCEAPGGLLKAIKFVFGDLQEASEDGQRAEQELKALSRVKTVRHPYILSLERYDIIDGQLLIVMELADRNLWDRFKECRGQGLQGIPREEMLRYMEEAAEALDLMNVEYQLQHLDIKPQNIFLIHNHIKVADFGLVKDLEGMVASVTGGVTPVYASPETFDGWVSRFSDQYSLSIVYQELLTGQRPFPGGSVRQLILQHLQGKPDLSSLSPADRPAIARGLAKNPEERHPNCRSLVEALRNRGAAPVSVVVEAPHAAAREARCDDTALPPIAALSPDEASSIGSAQQPELLEASSQPYQQPATRWIRVHEEAVRKAESVPVGPRPAPAAVQGDGVLFPALVVGVGHLGLGMLQRLRHRLHTRFGSSDVLASLRLLYLDTDPSVLRTATRAGPDTALSTSEVLLARLNRPSHYLKPREGRAALDTWIDSRMLYRIPRGLETSGIRALGRLAFCDNHAAIARRLHSELEQCTNSETLASAARRTGLGMRSNRPRVYIVAGLGGGTGGGMFLDLAYVVRQQLKELGYGEPDVIGLFLLPAVDRSPGRTVTMGNTFAALTELNHFASPATQFTARYQDKGAALQDADAPFNRCFLLHLPPPSEEAKTQEVLALAGDFLFRDLTNPLGRIADVTRAAQAVSQRKNWGLSCQTFGACRITFPRQQLAEETARCICRRLVERWITKDSKPIVETVRTWVEQQWTEQGLGAECFIGHLQEVANQSLRKAPETVFAELIAPLSLAEALPADEGGPAPRKRAAAPARPRAPGPVDLDLVAAAAVLHQLEDLVGKPDEPGVAPHAGKLMAALTGAADNLVAQLGQKLSRILVALIEQPTYRLVGAEEAIRQMIPLLEKVLEHHESLGKELTGRAAEAHKRLRALLEPVTTKAPNGRPTPPVSAADLMELLRCYPKWRYQSLILEQLARSYVSLRGNLSDQLREINFCRARLAELQRMFEGNDAKAGASRTEAPPAAAPASALEPGRALFPGGSRSMSDAVEQLLAKITPTDVQALDEKVQAAISQELTALVHVCLSSSNLLKNLEGLMQREVVGFVQEGLNGIDAAQLFLENYADYDEAVEAVTSAFQEAAPKLPMGRTTPQPEVCVLATPRGPAGDRFRELAEETLEDSRLATVGNSDDIIFYRELPNVTLADLEHLGPLGYEAYRHMTGVQHFTPHTRTDITEWRAATGRKQLDLGDEPDDASAPPVPLTCP